MRFGFRAFAAGVVAVGLVMAAPAAAQSEDGGYRIVGAQQAKRVPNYLTLESVSAKLRPAVAAQLPPVESRRLVLLNVSFQALRSRDKLVKLTPSDLQVQWDAAGGTRVAAPVLGAHVAKDMMPMGSSGFYTAMGPDNYELFAIIPTGVASIDLAQKQADGSFKVVRQRIGISAPRR